MTDITPSIIILLCRGATELELARASSTWREQVEHFEGYGALEREGDVIRMTDDWQSGKRTLTVGEMIARAGGAKK